MKKKTKVLLSWVAINNDPYEREKSGEYRRDENNELLWGPSLNILFNKNSCYLGVVSDVIFLFRSGDREKQIVKDTAKEVSKFSGNKIKVHSIAWKGDDPTDHQGIYHFIKNEIPNIRKSFPSSELVIHISPGTPSMHTIWILMGETGMISPPYTLVKSYRKRDLKSRAPVVPINIGIETFYKAYQEIKTTNIVSEESSLFWDQALFKSHKLISVFEQARRFASLKVPVMILGERGTGKTNLASWIRTTSKYRKKELDNQWPSVACGQYTSELMASELFGHKKGAFTGAHIEKKGLLSVADGDTLFLDEVGDISKNLQRLLIKALEEKSFLPLGSTAPVKSNFRLLTATNLTWNDLQKKLDADFLDRISPLTIKLPALREIPEDIPWLWEKVFQMAIKNAEASIPTILLKKISFSSLTKNLQQHFLPGNLRDLFRVAYRLIAILNDPFADIKSEEITQVALEGLEEIKTEECSGMSQKVASAWSESKPLEFLVAQNQLIPTKTLDSEFKSYLASEILRIARVRNVPIEEICDVNPRTVKNWIS